MENLGNTDDFDNVVKDSSRDGIQEHDFADEFPSELPSMAMLVSSAPSVGSSSPYASLQVVSSASMVNDHDGRDDVHVGRKSGIEEEEHAPPSETMLTLGLETVDSMERPQGGAVRSGMTNSERAQTRAHDTISVATDSGLYTEDGCYEAERRWTLACGVLGLVGKVVAIVVLLVQAQSSPISSSLAWPTRAPTFSMPPCSTPEKIACNFISVTDLMECRSTFQFRSKTTGSTIPSEIGLLTQQLTVMDLSKESLTSTIPSEIGLLTKLTVLNFYSNLLISSIPSEIGLLTQLLWLYFGRNTLTSTIPSEIRRLTLLLDLSFYDDSLTSGIPSEIGLLTQLTVLDFSINSLTSSIPSEIGILTKLKFLSFGGNSLTSRVPSEIGLLTQLTVLSFSSNSLTGTIPASLCSLPSPPSIYIDDGEITCASGCCS